MGAIRLDLLLVAIGLADRDGHHGRWRSGAQTEVDARAPARVRQRGGGRGCAFRPPPRSARARPRQLSAERGDDGGRLRVRRLFRCRSAGPGVRRSRGSPPRPSRGREPDAAQPHGRARHRVCVPGLGGGRHCRRLRRARARPGRRAEHGDAQPLGRIGAEDGAPLANGGRDRASGWHRRLAAPDPAGTAAGAPARGVRGLLSLHRGERASAPQPRPAQADDHGPRHRARPGDDLRGGAVKLAGG